MGMFCLRHSRPSCSLRNGSYKLNLQLCYFASRLFVWKTQGIKSSQCCFMKVNFHRKEAQRFGVSCKSKKQGGALHITCGADKILVANKGEIAVRIIRTAHEMGIPCVAVYSTADKDALHVKLADESVCIGEAPGNELYLDIPIVLSAAISHGCTMLHPGYGLLAQNVLFVEMCSEYGISFIGPNPDSIRVMGDKSTARKIMKKAGVPIVPECFGLLQSIEEAVKLAHEIGFPVLIKATVGAGGRGMRLAKEPDEFVKLLQQAKHEAAAAFGKDGVYLEKYIQNPWHIEFLVLADKYGNVVQFGELDCSIQRRNQKLLEEASSPALTPELRKAMGDAAVAAAASIGYIGVGMVKFLLDERGSFYFMEMNTLSEVEHPVTEMISSVDLIKKQIRVAMGGRLRYKQEDIVPRAHSIESHINAEVSFKGFQTGTGRITSDLPSRGPFVRMDSYVNPDYVVPSSYDSLLGKIIQQAKQGVFDGKDRHVKSAPLLHTLSRTKLIGVAEELLLELNSKSQKFLPSESTLSALMLCFAENGLIPQALIVWDQLFNSSFVPDIQIVSQLFKALTKRRHFDKASEILVQLSSRNFDFLPEAYSLAISCFGSGGQLELMEKTIQEMALRGFSVDPTVANSYVIYYSIYGSLTQIEAAYNRLKKSRYSIGKEGIRAMSLAYLKQRKFYQLGEFMRDVGLARRNVGNLLWNLLLLSYAANFKMKTLQREFLSMIESGFHPDITTFNVRTLAFSKMCLLWDLHLSLEHMKRVKVVPDLVTYGCVVDAYLDRRLGRNLDFALKKMNVNDSPIMLTDPFVFEVLGKGDFHSSSEAFLEFSKQKEWTYRKLIAVYMKKQYRRNQIFWNY